MRSPMKCTTLFTALLTVLACTGAAAQQPALRPVTDAMLQNPEPGEWLSWRRTLNHWGYSPLTQLNKRNVAQLRLVWTRPLAQGVQEGTPLVHDGVMFLPTPGGGAQAIDATNGDFLWEFRAPTPKEGNGNVRPTPTRNIAIYGNNIYVTTGEDRKSVV